MKAKSEAKKAKENEGPRDKPGAPLTFQAVKPSELVSGRRYLVATKTPTGVVYMSGKWNEDLNMFVSEIIDEEYTLLFQGQPYIDLSMLGN